MLDKVPSSAPLPCGITVGPNREGMAADADDVEGTWSKI
jgi:hypothetical protein